MSIRSTSLKAIVPRVAQRRCRRIFGHRARRVGQARRDRRRLVGAGDGNRHDLVDRAAVAIADA